MNRRIGVYGGTFDPIHRGHMAAARAACEALELDLLLLIPDGQPPHKDLSSGSASAADRLEMTEIAADRLNVRCRGSVTRSMQTARYGMYQPGPAWVWIVSIIAISTSIRWHTVRH